MSKQLSRNIAQRYFHKTIVEHLASQYVLGTLTSKVHQRVIKIAEQNEQLEERINFWQEKFAVLDQHTAELTPTQDSWQVIAQQLEITKPELNRKTKDSWLTKIATLLTLPNKLSTALSFAVVALLAVVLLKPFDSQIDQLSYVAVLTQQAGEAHLVATTYGESKTLVVNIINSPELSAEQSLELWVVSKTDAQARSLGLIPVKQTLLEQRLSQAQWRLIKDSESLIVTVEELGGSPIGEPSDVIVSRGLCVRLQEWQKNA